MRNQLARGALAACLAAAVAAAQAPASEDNRIGSQRFGEPRLGDGGGGDDWRARSDWAGETPQGDEYSLHSLFQQHHGDFMNRRERFRPQIQLGASFWPNQRIKDEPGSFDMIGYHADIDAPVLVSPDGYLKFGAYYQGRRYQFSSAFGSRGNIGNIPDDTLHAAGVKLGFGVFLDDAGNVLFEAETRPGAWSDLDGTLHHEDFDFPSHAMFTLRAMDNLFFKVGARYNQVFEDAPWLPILGISWEIVDGFRLDLLAPERVELSYWTSPAFGILFGAEVWGAEYHVRTSLQGQENNPPGRANARVQEVVTYLGLVNRINDYTSFAARAGLVVAGDYDLTSGANGFDYADGALDQGFFADFSFGVNF